MVISLLYATDEGLNSFSLMNFNKEKYNRVALQRFRIYLAPEITHNTFFTFLSGLCL